MANPCKKDAGDLREPTKTLQKIIPWHQKSKSSRKLPPDHGAIAEDCKDVSADKTSVVSAAKTSVVSADKTTVGGLPRHPNFHCQHGRAALKLQLPATHARNAVRTCSEYIMCAGLVEAEAAIDAVEAEGASESEGVCEGKQE